MSFNVQQETREHNLNLSEDPTLVHQNDMTASMDEYDVKEDTPKF